MRTTADAIDRIAPTREPLAKPVGYQEWTDLLFLHWRLPARDIEPLIPEGLTLDTFDGEAWVGLVAFGMSGLRPWWLPPLPGLSTFLETNVRTYVHCEGKRPGVWFFSLDASNALAVHGARWRWGLAYHRAVMRLTRHGNRVRYASERLIPGKIGPSTEIEAHSGDLIGSFDKSLPPGQAVPGTLEHFLAERYILYSRKPGCPLRSAQVHHQPYPLREAKLTSLDESLLQASGIERDNRPDHVMFSEGVRVKIFALRTVDA